MFLVIKQSSFFHFELKFFYTFSYPPIITPLCCRICVAMWISILHAPSSPLPPASTPAGYPSRRLHPRIARISVCLPERPASSMPRGHRVWLLFFGTWKLRRWRVMTAWCRHQLTGPRENMSYHLSLLNPVWPICGCQTLEILSWKFTNKRCNLSTVIFWASQI
jgi:hypothetical protein